MTMREDCRHYESRTYDNGETARFCILDLAPEAPWRCPENCPSFAHSLDDGSFETGSLAATPVEDEPDDDPEEISSILREAEEIVASAEPEVIRDLETPPRPRRGWRFWRRPPEEGEFRLSQR